jgi:uncharacterized integral membrane protein
MKIISGLIGLVIILLAVCFALSNRQSAAISLWPMAGIIQAPLFLLSLGTLIFGVFVGGVIVWGSALAQRLEMRLLRREIKSLNEKIMDFQQSVIPLENTNNNSRLRQIKNRFGSFKL